MHTYACIQWVKYEQKETILTCIYISTCIVSTKSCITSEEVKQIAETLLQQIQHQMQENQNELKAEIQQLKNTTTGELY